MIRSSRAILVADDERSGRVRVDETDGKSEQKDAQYQQKSERLRSDSAKRYLYGTEASIGLQEAEKTNADHESGGGVNVLRYAKGERSRLFVVDVETGEIECIGDDEESEKYDVELIVHRGEVESEALFVELADFLDDQGDDVDENHALRERGRRRRVVIGGDPIGVDDDPEDEADVRQSDGALTNARRRRRADEVDSKSTKVASIGREKDEKEERAGERFDGVQENHADVVSDGESASTIVPKLVHALLHPRLSDELEGERKKVQQYTLFLDIPAFARCRLLRREASRRSSSRRRPLVPDCCSPFRWQCSPNRRPAPNSRRCLTSRRCRIDEKSRSIALS